MVLEATLSVQVVVPEGRTSCKHAALPLHLECSMFQFEQVDLSHRCRFSCDCMSSVSVLQCPGSTDTLYGREPRRQGWHRLAHTAETLKLVRNRLCNPPPSEKGRLHEGKKWCGPTQNQLDSS